LTKFLPSTALATAGLYRGKEVVAIMIMIEVITQLTDILLDA